MFTLVCIIVYGASLNQVAIHFAPCETPLPIPIHYNGMGPYVRGANMSLTNLTSILSAFESNAFSISSFTTL